ncbi:MAG: MaoC family dehydratase N-terminal domain-containing protein [Actinomycetota bacterium]
MNESAKGTVLFSGPYRVAAEKLMEMESAIGTPTGATTARLVPFFGPVIAGETALITHLGLRMDRGLLVGQDYEWERPVEPDEVLQVEIRVEDVYTKGTSQFGVVLTEALDGAGRPVQRQRTTFIERLDA